MDEISAYLIREETITGKQFMKIYRELKGLPDPEEEKKAEPAQEAEQEAAPEAPQPAEAAPEVQAEPAPEEEPEPVPAEQPKPQMPRGRFSDIPMDQVSKDDTSV